MTKGAKVLWGIIIVTAVALFAWFGVTRRQQSVQKQETPVAIESIAPNK